MGVQLSIEQMIINHNIGVNISDAKTFNGKTIDQFSLVGHTHSANDIVSGIMDPARLPIGTATAKGIVQLSTSTSSEATDIAATPSAVLAVKNVALSKADLQHTHSPSDITGGTFPDQLTAAKVTVFSDYAKPQLRNFIFSTNAPDNTIGVNGDIWIQYS